MKDNRNSKKEIQKRMLIKKTLNDMNRQIQKLESQKQVYVDAAKQAKQQGLSAQYNLALSGLKMTTIQQKKIYEMKLNFEITSQMKDMSQMTSSFLSGMGALSKDMAKLTKEKDFLKVESRFNNAMESMEMQTERLSDLMDNTSAAFESNSPMSEEDKKELEGLIDVEASGAEMSDEMIEKELQELQKKMS